METGLPGLISWTRSVWVIKVHCLRNLKITKHEINITCCLSFWESLVLFSCITDGIEGKKDLWTVTLLFIMTGFAILVYLNQAPLQPRERDYAYAGSFYAFTIWIGIGVLGLYEALKKYIPDTTSAGVAGGLSLLLVPVLMGAQNWDDHDRSNRYTCRDFGANYLNTCAPNAVIFTNGDNDTFPL